MTIFRIFKIIRLGEAGNDFSVFRIDQKCHSQPAVLADPTFFIDAELDHPGMLNAGHPLTVAGPNIHDNRRVLAGIESALASVSVPPSITNGGRNHVRYLVSGGPEAAQSAVKVVYQSLFR